MTEKDRRLLVKIATKQSSLALLVTEYKIKSTADSGSVSPVIRRGLVGFIADIFELTVPLTDNTRKSLPFNMLVMKEFRNTATHQYGSITDAIAFACLQHCVDKSLIKAIEQLISGK